MFDKVLSWWKSQDIALHIFTPASLGVDKSQFNRQRRIHAEAWASQRFYVLADDDCLPPEGNILEAAFTELASHPDFAILSAMPSNATINRWTPEGYVPYEDEFVMEHVSVGGIRFMRRGCLDKWPHAKGPRYDAEHCQALRDGRWRVGYLKAVTMIHLGERKSSLWPNQASTS